MGKTRDDLRHPIVRRYGAVTKAMTRTRLVAVSITAGLFLTGCAGGPSKIGSAAIVGDTAIPLETVQQRFDAWLAAYSDGSGAQRERQGLANLGRAQASVLVSRELVRQVAKAEGVTYSEEEVQELIKQVGGSTEAAAQTLETPANYHQSVRAQLLAAAIGRRHIQNLRITMDFTTATSRTEAERKAKEMAQSEQAATALVRKDVAGMPANPQTGQSAEQSRLNQTLPVTNFLGQQTPRALMSLFTVPAGTVVGVSLNSGQQGGGAQQWIVARVKSRTDQPTSGTSPGEVAEQAGPSQLELVGQAVISHYAAGQKIEINPRYGVWEPTSTDTQARITGPGNPAPTFSIPARAEVQK